MIDWSKWHYECKNEDELTEITQGIVDGKIFTTDHVKKEDMDIIRSLFLAPTMLGSPASGEAMDRENIEMYYADKAHAGPWKEKNYPVFLACGFLNKVETERVRATVRTFTLEREQAREAERLKNNEAESE